MDDLPTYDQEKFSRWLSETTSLSNQSVYIYQGIIKGMYNSGVKKTTNINAYIREHERRAYRSALKYYLKFIGQKIELRPVKEKPPRPRELPTLEDFMRVVNNLSEDDKYIAMFLLNSGCRVHEAFKVKRKDISPNGKVVLETKGGKYRTIFLGTEFHKNLFWYLTEKKGLAENDYIFWTNRVASLRSKGVLFWQALNRKSKEIIGKYVGTHDFRRFYGMYMYNACEKDIVLVQRLLGHADISTTERYVRYALTEDDINRAKEKIDKLTSQDNYISDQAEQIGVED